MRNAVWLARIVRSGVGFRRDPVQGWFRRLCVALPTSSLQIRNKANYAQKKIAFDIWWLGLKKSDEIRLESWVSRDVIAWTARALQISIFVSVSRKRKDLSTKA